MTVTGTKLPAATVLRSPGTWMPTEPAPKGSRACGRPRSCTVRLDTADPAATRDSATTSRGRHRMAPMNYLHVAGEFTSLEQSADAARLYALAACRRRQSPKERDEQTNPYGSRPSRHGPPDRRRGTCPLAERGGRLDTEAPDQRGDQSAGSHTVKLGAPASAASAKLSPSYVAYAPQRGRGGLGDARHRGNPRLPHRRPDGAQRVPHRHRHNIATLVYGTLVGGDAYLVAGTRHERACAASSASRAAVRHPARVSRNVDSGDKPDLPAVAGVRQQRQPSDR